MHILPETKPCECGMKMILRSNGPTILTLPPQSPTEWYCGGCGHVKLGPNSASQFGSVRHGRMAAGKRPGAAVHAGLRRPTLDFSG